MQLIALFVLATTTAVAGTQAQPAQLETGKPIAREIAGGDTHVYRVELDAGQAMHVVVNQLGADIVLSLVGIDGARVAQVDSPNGPSGPESAWLIAAAAGSYGVEIRPLGKGTKGRYEVRLELVRAATEDDRGRVALQDAVADGLRLVRARTPDGARAAVEKLREAVALARKLNDMAAAHSMTMMVSTLDAGEAARIAGLSALSGGANPVYYSAGGQQRAQSLQARFDSGVRFFEQTLNVRPKIAMAVLSRDDWDYLSAIPYPMNWSRWVNGAGLIGMTVAPEFAAMYLPRALKTIPAATLREIEASGASFERDMHAQFDDGVYHELGHVYTSAAGIGTPNLWFGEFMADYLSVTHAAQDPARWSRRKYDEIGREWFAANVTPMFKSLQEFDSQWVRMSNDNYAWYHMQLMHRAYEVYEKHGLDFVMQVKAAFPTAERAVVSVDDALARLEKISPGFVAWAAGLPATK